MSDADVYMMKSRDGIRFEPMFSNRSLDWSDTKNVMWFDHALDRYVAYIRIDNGLPIHAGLHPASTVNQISAPV